MGMQDRDWYRELQKERELAATKQRFAAYSAGSSGSPRPKERSLFSMILFWIVIMGLIFWGMKYSQHVRPAKTVQAGQWVIPRSLDGHFYVEGTVNGVKTSFMVDTGASLVTVSEAFAQRANLKGGTAITFNTANGMAPGRALDDVLVSIGTGNVPVKLGVGLKMTNDRAESLLGQSFLTQFEVSFSRDQMVLRSE
jgi:aspartyl protease family protein